MIKYKRDTIQLRKIQINNATNLIITKAKLHIMQGNTTSKCMFCPHTIRCLGAIQMMTNILGLSIGIAAFVVVKADIIAILF